MFCFILDLLFLRFMHFFLLFLILCFLFFRCSVFGFHFRFYFSILFFPFFVFLSISSNVWQICPQTGEKLLRVAKLVLSVCLFIHTFVESWGSYAPKKATVQSHVEINYTISYNIQLFKIIPEQSQVLATMIFTNLSQWDIFYQLQL